MDQRILVKISAQEYGINFQTVSRWRKSGQQFYILREKLALLEHEQSIVVSDIHSFAILRRNIPAGTVMIDFSWLNGCETHIQGWEQTVTLPYDKLMDFVRSSAGKDGSKSWHTLSMQKRSNPNFLFTCEGRLRECLENPTVRHKLSCALRDNFKYPYVDQIIFFRDSVPFSFLFREVRKGKFGICGALILHNYQDDLKKAYYSVHT